VKGTVKVAEPDDAKNQWKNQPTYQAQKPALATPQGASSTCTPSGSGLVAVAGKTINESFKVERKWTRSVGDARRKRSPAISTNGLCSTHLFVRSGYVISMRKCLTGISLDDVLVEVKVDLGCPNAYPYSKPLAY
jgi:hypothetical protein